MIAIFENAGLLSKRLVEFIEEQVPGVIVRDASSPLAALQLLNDETPSAILLVNFICPGVSALLPEIFHLSPQPMVVVLYHVYDTRRMEEYKEMGVTCFLDIYFEFERLPGLIREAEEKAKKQAG